MMKKMMFLIAMMLISLQGFAATGWAEINVTALRAGISPNYHYVYFDPIDLNLDPNGCGSDSEAVYPTSNDWKIFHSMVLAALLADKTLNVRFNGCQSGRPKIDTIEIWK